jgi:transcriptional regulator with XRE-family HTH domain
VPFRLKALKPKEADFEPQALGEHLKRCRLQRSLSQIEVAQTLDVTAATILNWEKGYSRPLAKAIPALLQFLGETAGKNCTLVLLLKRRSNELDLNHP